MEAELAKCHSVFLVSGRNPQNYLYDQHRRSAQSGISEDYQEPWCVSERRGCIEIAVSGDEEYSHEMGRGAGLESCPESVCAALGRSDSSCFSQMSGCAGGY